MSFLNVRVLGWVCWNSNWKEDETFWQRISQMLVDERGWQLFFLEPWLQLWKVVHLENEFCWAPFASCCRQWWQEYGLLSDSSGLVVWELFFIRHWPLLLCLTRSGILECFLSSRFTPEESLPFSSLSLSPSLSLSQYSFNCLYLFTGFLRWSPLGHSVWFLTVFIFKWKNFNSPHKHWGQVLSLL